MIDPAKINDAMQGAPFDGKEYRLARAAIKAVLTALVEQGTTWADGIDEATQARVSELAAAELAAAALK